MQIAYQIKDIYCVNILFGLVFKIDFDKVEKSGRKKTKLSRGILYGDFFMDIWYHQTILNGSDDRNVYFTILYI